MTFDRQPAGGRDATAPLQTLQGELNRLFEEYWSPGRAASAPTDLETPAWSPPIDLAETPGEFWLRVDLPGVDPAGVDLSLTGMVLTLRGEKPAVSTPGSHDRARERAAGMFVRQVTLPVHVEFDRVEAECKDGVLTVRLPKESQARPRAIPIRPS